MDIKLINQVLYNLFLYLPLVGWLFVKSSFIQNSYTKFEDFFNKKMQIQHKFYNFKTYFYSLLLLSFIVYATLGSIVALFQAVIGFKSTFLFDDSLFIFKAMGTNIEIVLLVSILASMRLIEMHKLNFSFAKSVVKNEKDPKKYIQKIYFKAWLAFVLYSWILLNIYYQIVGKFLVLQGAKYVVLPLIF